MKRVLALVALLTGICSASFLFGPAGMPESWTITDLIAEVITVNDSLLTQDSTIVMLPGGVYLADDDSLLVYSDKYIVYFRQATASAGDRNVGWAFVEEDGTEHLMYWLDANSYFYTSEAFRAGAITGTSLQAGLANNITLTSSALQSEGTVLDITINPAESGYGDLQLGGGQKDSIIILAADTLVVQGPTYLIEADQVVCEAWTCYHTISPASANLGPTAPTVATSNTFNGLAFDANAELVSLQWEIPDDWSGTSDITLKVYWTNEAGDNIADGEKLDMEIAYRSIVWGTEGTGNGTAESDSLVYTQSGAGVDGDTHVSTLTLDYDSTDQPLTAGDVLGVRFWRDKDDDNDTYAGDLVVILWEVSYTSVGFPNHW